jgi:Ribosomal S17
VKRLRYSQVRGISIKMQEEERERSDNYVPKVSALESDIIIIEVDAKTNEMLKMLVCVKDILLPRHLTISRCSLNIFLNHKLIS